MKTNEQIHPEKFIELFRLRRRNAILNAKADILMEECLYLGVYFGASLNIDYQERVLSRVKNARDLMTNIAEEMEGLREQLTKLGKELDYGS